MQGRHMDFFYLIGGAAVLLMTFLLHRFGNAWIDRLYASHRDILTFPLAVKERGRLRRFLLPLAFLLCGARGLHRIKSCRAFLPALCRRFPSAHDGD